MYLRTVIQLLVITLITAEELYDRDLVKPRIFKGRPTLISNTGGYAVQIMQETSLTCTGCLLSQRHVLTAAHCFQDANYRDFYVVAGQTYIENSLFPEERNYVVQAIIHPDYRKYEFIADIAVLGVKNPIKGPIIGYLPLCSVLLHEGDMVTVSGWGKSEAKWNNDILRIIEVPMVSKSKCSEQLGRKLPINVLCAGGYDGKTICSGDSGGPLVFNGEVCGISIWTYFCENSEKPDVYMSVYVYRDFIKSAMKEIDNYFERESALVTKAARRVNGKNGKF